MKFCIFAVEIHLGVGRHSYYLSLNQVINANKWETIANFLISVGNLFLRLSIACMLLRLIASNKKWRFSLYGIMGFVVVTNIPTAIIILTWCRPAKKIWNPTVPGECWSPNAAKWIAVYLNGGSYHPILWFFVLYGFEIINGTVVAILCDTTLALMPTVFLWNVQMNMRTKVGICCLMGLGLMWVLLETFWTYVSMSTAEVNKYDSSASCATVRTILNSNLSSKDVTCKQFLELSNGNPCTADWHRPDTWVPIGTWAT